MSMCSGFAFNLERCRTLMPAVLMMAEGTALTSTKRIGSLCNHIQRSFESVPHFLINKLTFQHRSCRMIWTVLCDLQSRQQLLFAALKRECRPDETRKKLVINSSSFTDDECAVEVCITRGNHPEASSPVWA